MRKASTLLPAVALASLFLTSPKPVSAETNFGQVAMHVAYMLQNHHYSHHEFDDAISKKVLESYLNFLDGNRAYLTQQDVDKFRADYATTLDEHVLTRNISPAIDIYQVYEQRVKERIAYAKQIISKNNFTFDSDRTLSLNREKVDWPKDKAASDTLWNDIIEGDILSERLADKARAENEKKKAEEAEKSGKPAPKSKVAEVESIDKRVLKRYERHAEQLAENEHEDIVNYFLSCLATSYDPHTEYMSQQETDNFRTSMTHKLVGIGALLTTNKDNLAEIQGIVVGGPADKQGELKLSDRIVSVAQGEKGEWVDIKFMKLQKIVEMIRGKEGSIVRLKINPASAEDPSITKEILITRGQVDLKENLANADLIQTPAVNGKSTKIGWINLPSFYADMEEGTVSCSADVEKLLKRLMAENIEGLVFDLRGDGGGSLEEAIKLTGLFIPKGPVVQAKDWRDNITWRDSESERPVYNGPMIVLTDKASASASEIFAAALQDYRRAVVMGEKSTFGKGTVQTILPVERFMPFFSDKSRAGALKVTIQKFYRIAGGSTQLRGVIPDVILPSVRDALKIGEDALPNALPYDTIDPRTFTYFSKSPLPLDELRSRVQSRVKSNPEFQYIMEDTTRLEERMAKNTISLNEGARLKELQENKERNEARKSERKQRVATVKEKEGEPFKTYRLTLDNVNAAELVEDSKFTKEQSTGMKMAATGDEEGSEPEENQWAFGIEPVKLETLNAMRDLIDLQSKQPQTAVNTGEQKKPAPEQQPAQ